MNDLFASIDKMDTPGFASHLHPDVEFRFGNGESVHGRDNAAAAVGGFFSSIKAIKHSMADVKETDDLIVSQGKVTYTRHDDSTLTVPFANLFYMKDNLIKNYFIFVDTSELYKSA
ncbi:MAG: nuclear transport factor 2 family protein [bacterium]|nr:nuclear transport factor 2 family protein [bacterium]